MGFSGGEWFQAVNDVWERKQDDCGTDQDCMKDGVLPLDSSAPARNPCDQPSRIDHAIINDVTNEPTRLKFAIDLSFICFGIC
jgi:hypothetical protein